MGIICAIIGKSGVGKTYSIRNLDPEKVGIISAINKPFPFKDKGFKVLKTNSYGQIAKVLKSNNLKTYVIDDSNFLLVSEAFEKADIMGYQKYTKMAQNFYNLLKIARDNTSEDTVVFFLHHAAEEDTGYIHMQIMGKILSNWISPEAFFSINLLADKTNRNYIFKTYQDNSSVKAPPDLFNSEELPNDLMVVEEAIRKYYGIER